MDNALIKKILESYQNIPVDKDTLLGFTNSIFSKINAIRITVTNTGDSETSNQSPYNMNESYCHAFYRMCGLPVIGTNGDFYNPGYYSTLNNDKKKRDEIAKKQHVDLKNQEISREYFCFYNLEAFLARTDGSLDDKSVIYKINMLKYPRSLCAFKEAESKDKVTSLAFKKDMQVKTIKGRSFNYEKVYHILRPFKCVPDIASVDNIKVQAKNLAAPFFQINNDPNISNYQATYLETVCRMRLANSSGTIVDQQIKDLNTILETVNINGTQLFGSLLKNQNTLETYIAAMLMAVFINVVIEYAKKITEFKNLGKKIDISLEKATPLTEKIDFLKAQIQYYETFDLFMPPEITTNKGYSLQTSNVHNGIFASNLISLLGAPAADLKKSLKSYQSEYEKIQQEVGSINQNMFYYTGEVFGIGSIDILAIMIAFWTLPLDYLVSMLDTSSFDRLCNSQSAKMLQNAEVQTRKANNGAPTVKIEDVITELDKSIYYLLSLADEIVSYVNKDSTKK